MIAASHVENGVAVQMRMMPTVVTNIAFWFTMLSPLIGLIIAFMGASFFSQSSF
jgi:hypothetical protein